MTVTQDAVVTIAYTLKDDDGAVLDSSEGNGDLAYLHGHQNIVSGLENALTGKAIGDKVETMVVPAEGYGDRVEELVFSVPRSHMPEGELEVGMEFRAQAEDGQEMVVSIAEVGDDEVTLDGNHPLAGQNLHFSVTIQGIRSATEEEIAHGHVHDGSHHHHH